MRKNTSNSISSNVTTYIESERLLKGGVMQAEVAIDEKTGETCMKGFDSKNKMKVTLLFKSDSVSDTETVVTEALKRSFMERIKKEIV